jgi:transaldolase
MPRDPLRPDSNPQPARAETDVRLFLDSADPADWERWLPLGLFHGVTTNPLLLEKAGQACTVANLADLARRACELGAAEIQLQTWGQDIEQMIATGEKLAELGQGDVGVVIKIPATDAGFRAARILRDRGHGITLTAVFTCGQVLAAAGMKAAYAAPYLGRLDDAGRDGAATVLAMREILTRTGAPTRLLTASLRSAQQVVELAAQGLNTFTIGPGVVRELLESGMTTAAAAAFQRAAAAMGDQG